MKLKQAWKGKDFENYIVLKKLSKGDILERKNFEKPNKGAEDFSGIEKAASGQFIPHASVIQRLKYLEECNFVKKLRHERKSKRGIPIPRYQIGIYGFIELFRLSAVLKKGRPFNNMKELLPAFAEELESLKEIFSEKTMSDILQSICKNLSVNVTTHQKKDFKDLNDISKSILQNNKSIQIHEIKMNVSQQDPYYSVTERIVLSKKNNSEQFSESLRPNIITRQLIIFAFFYELLRCINSKTCEIKTTRNHANKVVFGLIRANGVFRGMLHKYLGEIQNNLYQEIEQVDKIIKEI